MTPRQTLVEGTHEGRSASQRQQGSKSLWVVKLRAPGYTLDWDPKVSGLYRECPQASSLCGGIALFLAFRVGSGLAGAPPPSILRGAVVEGTQQDGVKAELEGFG